MAFRHANDDHHDNIGQFDSEMSRELLDIYNKHLQDELYESRNKPATKSIVPSSVRCMRRIWFRLRGVDRDNVSSPDVYLDFIANMGTACHEMIQKRLITYLGDNWIILEDYLNSHDIHHTYKLTNNGYETLIELLDIPVRFSVDGILFLDDTYTLLEIKSVDHRTFQDMYCPKSEHLDQVKCYCTLLDLDYSLMLYIDRTDGHMKCYTYNVTSGMKDNMNSYFDTVMKCVDSNIAPPGLPTGDKWCNPNMCDYYQKCKSYGR